MQPAEGTVLQQYFNFRSIPEDVLPEKLREAIERQKFSVQLYQEAKAVILTLNPSSNKLDQFDTQLQKKFSQVRDRCLTDFISKIEASSDKDRLKASWLSQANEHVQQIKDLLAAQLQGGTTPGHLREEIEKKLASALSVCNEASLPGNQEPVEYLQFFTDTITHSEFAGKILSSLKDPLSSKPSCSAKISEDKISLTIKLIDDVFLIAIENYRRTFLEAFRADVENSRKPRDSSSDFAISLSSGAALFLKMTPDIPVIKQTAAPILALIGGIYGMVHQEPFIKEVIQREQSFHRNQWLNQVKIKEEIRTRQAVEHIHERAQTIQAFFDRNKKKMTLEDPLAVELIQLDTFICTHSPESPIWLNGRGVTEYLLYRLGNRV